MVFSRISCQIAGSIERVSVRPVGRVRRAETEHARRRTTRGDCLACPVIVDIVAPGQDPLRICSRAICHGSAQTPDAPSPRVHIRTARMSPRFRQAMRSWRARSHGIEAAARAAMETMVSVGFTAIAPGMIDASVTYSPLCTDCPPFFVS